MKITRSTWIFSAACFLPLFAFATRPNVWAQLASMAALLMALFWCATLALQASLKWRERGIRNLVSCLLIVAAFPAALICGHALRNALFSRELDRWNQAVVWVATNHKPGAEHPIKLPPQFSDLARTVHYKYDEACGLTIDFFWGGGFPVKHTVRRYALNAEWPDIKKCQAGWRRGRVITGRWFEISG